jgi:Protein of unknown function (DUF3891)
MRSLRTATPIVNGGAASPAARAGALCLTMLFRDDPAGVLAISQLAHAWISGQLLRSWSDPCQEPLLLAAEQHDIGWLDWETAPSFNPATGRPHLFREVGAAAHAPMWTKGVERALSAWGAHVALLVSRHGGVIYRRYTDRHRLAEADARAAQHFLDAQAPIEAAWAKALSLDVKTLERESALVALVDTLSLALCGDLKTPLEIAAPTRAGEMKTLHLVSRIGRPWDFVLSPWPFVRDIIVVEGEARLLPSDGRFADEKTMRDWFATSRRASFHARLVSDHAAD